MTKHNGWDSYLCQGKSDIGLVVMHEWWGLSDYVKSVATQLGSKGYWAAAVDLYKGKLAKTREEAMAIRKTVKREDVLSAVGASVDLLKSKGAKKIGTIGFCMGGGYALLGACNVSDVSFCVVYYGAIENAEEVNGLKGPTLMILASEDPNVTPWAWSSFLPAATKYKKRVEAHLYPNTGHAFATVGGERYDEKATKDAWERTYAFLSRI